MTTLPEFLFFLFARNQGMPVKPADKTELYIRLCFGNLLYKRGGRNVSQNHSITTSKKKKLKRGTLYTGVTGTSTRKRLSKSLPFCTGAVAATK